MRGGQVTIFVAIGLVLLIVVGLFYLVVASSARDSTQDQVRDTANVAILSSTIGSCVDSVVTDELITLGRAGGLVSFEGYESGVVDEGVRERRILYGITANRDFTEGFLPVTSPPPQYPNWSVTFKTAEIDARTGRYFAWFVNGYFGDVNFPAVCDTEGENRPGKTYSCRYYPGNPPGTSGPSVQELLEKRITQRVQACASPAAFTKAIGQEVEKVGTPETKITFTTSNTIVKLTYPVDLAGGTTTTLEEFQKVYNVRFLPVMQFAIDLARADTRNVTFEVGEDYPMLDSYQTGFTVIRSKAALTERPSGVSEHASLITIIDSQSTLDGRSYIFSFLAEHRPPMLEPITSSEWQLIENGGWPSRRLGADPDDGDVTVSSSYGGVPRGLRTITVTDADGEKDWQGIEQIA